MRKHMAMWEIKGGVQKETCSLKDLSNETKQDIFVLIQLLSSFLESIATTKITSKVALENVTVLIDKLKTNQEYQSCLKTTCPQNVKIAS